MSSARACEANEDGAAVLRRRRLSLLRRTKEASWRLGIYDHHFSLRASHLDYFGRVGVFGGCSECLPSSSAELIGCPIIGRPDLLYGTGRERI